MDQNETRIEELQSRIKDSQAELKDIFCEAGERVAGEKLYKGDDEAINKLLEALGEREKRLQNIDSQMDDLRTSYNRISEIAEREKEIGEEYALLEKENKKLFVPLGRVAYFPLKGGRGQEYGKSFDSLVEAEENLKEQDNEIFRLESSGGKKKFLENLKDKGRIAVLRSKKKRLESSMDNLFGKLGEKIYRKDPAFLDSIEDETVASFKENRIKMAALDKEIAQLKEENSNLEKHLKSEYNSSRQKKTEEKMQSRRDLALSDKMAGVYDLGLYLYREKIELKDNEVEQLFASAGEIYGKIENQEREIEKLKAELEIVNLEEEVTEMKKNIKDLEMTIEKCNSDISEFNNEIKRARAEIRKLKKLTE
ncbi:hypothetical protein [Spirochaeta isovalerica]|uniref:Chromosome segregation ATPase n=1 Tax=Spirochaeta isovalerica TaxID=150 RepID=A0A841R8H7_9SPIO|nr:hypothetical protein [Spirochaeta isovalerica]MBB6479487.1 chromosome segregation ATPase [Spirochaeta isovalerica]